MRARPLERFLYELSVRLGVVVDELEHLTIPQLARYAVVLTGREPAGDVEAKLLKVFGPRG
jgi:hypothetical protein